MKPMPSFMLTGPAEQGRILLFTTESRAKAFPVDPTVTSGVQSLDHSALRRLMLRACKEGLMVAVDSARPGHLPIAVHPTRIMKALDAGQDSFMPSQSVVARYAVEIEQKQTSKESEDVTDGDATA